MKDEWINRWQGRTVACIASGPSLTPEDCSVVRAAAHPTIVTNTTFRLCPWADVLFAFDGAWWRLYRKEVEQTFKGRCLTYSVIGKSIGIETLYQSSWFRHFNNSGAAAISLAMHGGAKRIVLLGYDCQKGPKGETHWHGDHAKGLGNARSMPNWSRHFKSVAKTAESKAVRIENATRSTALTCFARVDLQAALKHN